ncbi:MAG: hypothetical protein V1743_03665 [Nanoarchaeota archaeon]
MDILRKRIQIAELSNFELILEKLRKIDLSVLCQIKEVERQSFIIEHKFIFYAHVVDLDFSKITGEEISRLVAVLSQLKEFEEPLLSSMNTFRIADENTYFEKEDKRLVEYIQMILGKLFTCLKDAERLLKDVLEIPHLYNKAAFKELTDEEKKEWKKDLDQLYSALSDMLNFCAELEHYSEFWKKRVEQKPYIDAKYVYKKTQYVQFYEKNPQFHKRIVELENRIETAPSFTDYLHGALRSVAVHGASVDHPLHARLDKRYRIIYVWIPEEKKLIYLDVIHHDRIDGLKEVRV